MFKPVLSYKQVLFSLSIMDGSLFLWPKGALPPLNYCNVVIRNSKSFVAACMYSPLTETCRSSYQNITFKYVCIRTSGIYLPRTETCRPSYHKHHVQVCTPEYVLASLWQLTASNDVSETHPAIQYIKLVICRGRGCPYLLFDICFPFLQPIGQHGVRINTLLTPNHEKLHPSRYMKKKNQTRTPACSAPLLKHTRNTKASGQRHRGNIEIRPFSRQQNNALLSAC